MDSPTRLYLIRHAEVESRYQRVFGGRIDMGLSPLGLEQAQALGKYLERVPFDSIYASPMKRVQQTLAQIVAGQPKAATLLDGLREIDFGSWTGLSWDEIRVRYGVSAFQWLDQLVQGAISEAEAIPHFRARVSKALDQVLRESAGKTVAVLCHGGVLRMLLSLLVDIPLVKMAHFDFEYASLTIVDWTPSKIEVELLNFTPWRDSPG